MDNSNQPAFPIVEATLDGNNVASGLSKREYYAGQALMGLLANPNPGSIDKCAKMAVEAADLLIVELEKIKP